MRLAYSYIRFSSEHQRLGDSLRRQIASAEHYAKVHGLLLDTHSYRDLGVSAFKGKNAVHGKLGTFLRAVDSRVIPAQSPLLVESLDRLSRNDVDDALELFLSIVRRGVTLVTLADGQRYSTETIKRDRGISLIISILVPGLLYWPRRRARTRRTHAKLPDRPPTLWIALTRCVRHLRTAP